MRKIIIATTLILVLIGLTGCDLLKGRVFSNDDHEVCDGLIEHLTTSLSENDVASAKSLFAPRLYMNIETFDTDLQALIDYYDGELTSINGRVDTGEYSNYDYEEKHHSLEYTVITTKDTYRFSIYYVVKDSRTEDNVGILNLYVLKLSEDEYPEKRYFGALISSDGIYVAYPHILPKEE